MTLKQTLKQTNITTCLSDTQSSAFLSVLSDAKGHIYQKVLMYNRTDTIDITKPYKKYGEDGMPLWDGMVTQGLKLKALTENDPKLIPLENKRQLQVYWMFDENLVTEGIYNNIGSGFALLLFVIYYLPNTDNLYVPSKVCRVGMTTEQFDKTIVKSETDTATIIKTPIASDVNMGIAGDSIITYTYGFHKAQIFLMYPDTSATEIAYNTGKQRLYITTK